MEGLLDRAMKGKIFFADIYINSDGPKYLRQEACILE